MATSTITTAYKMGLKRQVVNALKPLFGATFPIPEYQNIYVGLEYPMRNADYPAIYVTYREREIQNVGVGYREIAYDDSGQYYPRKRFRFQGDVYFNVMTLSPLDRDRLSAALLNILAFADVKDNFGSFLDRLTSGEYVDLTPNLERIVPEGEQVGDVPWGNEDEKVFMASYGFPVLGEFVSRPTTQTDGATSKGDLTEIDSITVDPTAEVPDGIGTYAGTTINQDSTGYYDEAEYDESTYG
jgi:hypothetical protein